MLVIPAPAGPRVEHSAPDVGEKDILGLLLFELDQATASAAVAKTLPLGFGHFLGALRPPERNIGHGSPPGAPASASL